jgi:ElaB/YqjD/DUF883 family membrane-anchored ribosome-binding protein
MNMKTFEQTGTTANPMVDNAADKADAAIRSTQRATNSALDSLSSSVEDARSHVTPMLNRASEQATAMAQRGIDAVRNGSQQVRDKALHATDLTADYIKNDPIKAVLIAAATGAALMALVGLLSRSRRDY